MTGLSVRIIDEGGEVWNNSEGNSVEVRGSWEISPKPGSRRALTQSQAEMQLRSRSVSTLDALADLILPEIIDVDSTCCSQLDMVKEFSVACTVDTPLGELHLDGDFNVKVVPGAAVRWQILLNEAPMAGKHGGNLTGQDHGHLDSMGLKVRCDDEEDLRAMIQGEERSERIEKEGGRRALLPMSVLC